MARVKGSKIVTKLDFVSKVHGAEMRERVLQSLDSADREALGLVLSLNWYRIDLYERVLLAICAVAGGGDVAIYDRMGAHSAAQQFATSFKSLRSTHPLRMLENMVPMHAVLNDPARMEIVEATDTSCCIVVHAPRSNAPNCRVARAFYAATLEQCGCRGVHVSERACSSTGAPYCRFEVRWRSSAASLPRV